MTTDDTGLLEVCCASAAFAIEAERAGAHRVELCANLVEGGTTPSRGELECALEEVTVPVMVMIRPRGGDFLYSDLEYRIMERDVDTARDSGAHGVVIGLLTEEGAIDIPRTRALVDRARPLSVTFHRAFDVSKDHMRSIDALATAGVDRVLTSAGRARVIDALDTLGAIARTAGDDLSVLACGAVGPNEVDSVLSVPGVREVHVGASRYRDSAMQHRVVDVPMGRPYTPDEYAVEVADVAFISDVARRFSEFGR